MHSRWRRSLRFVLVGCGKAGHSYATILHNHPKTNLVAVVDTNIEAARAFAASFGCKHYASMGEYLKSAKMADCAVVCAYPVNNPEIACQLLQNGVHVLCETPFAPDSTSAGTMIETSRASGALLTMASKFRYVPDVIHARGLIRAGILGHVLEFKGDFRDIVDMRNRWNSMRELSGGGVLMERGGMAADIVHILFGPILSIHAEEGRRIQTKEVEDTVRLQVRTESGVMGTLHLSWTLNSAGDDYFRIYGTQGNLSIGWKKSMYRPNGAVDWICFGEGFSTMKALTLQISNFVNAVADGEPLEVNATDALESVRVVETAYESLQTGQRMELRPENVETHPAPERKFSLVSS